MNNENLIGTLALVHPEFKNDPARKQGQVGVITYVGKDDHKIYMSFPGRGECVYDGEVIMRLKDKNAVLEALVNEGDHMDVNDFKDLYKVTILQDRGTSTGLLSALEIARDNPKIWDKTLESAWLSQNLKAEKVLVR